MRYSPLNPPIGLLAALDTVVAGITAVRAQMHSLQAAESLLLHTADMLVRHIANATSDNKPTASALNMAYRTVQTEIGAAVHESDRAVSLKMGRAAELVSRYPAAFKSLSDGKISGSHANAIVDAGEIVTDEKARGSYEDEAVEYAEAESASRLRPVVKELAEKYSGEDREERYERARALRRVFVIERDDGMADLTAHLPAPYAYGIKDRLDQMARNTLDARRHATAEGNAGAGAADATGAEEKPVDNRTADQLRADLLTDMLLASNFDRLRTMGAPARSFKARVQVIVPVKRNSNASSGRARDTRNGRSQRTGVRHGSPPEARPYGSDQRGSDQRGSGLFESLFKDMGPAFDGVGLDSAGVDQPASPSNVPTLEGYGPISGSAAEEIMAEADCWERVIVDQGTGTVLSVDTYRPSAAQRRFLGARDLHCRFPGCRSSLAWCDIDHTIDAARGGQTSSNNLGHLCRRHHTLKHASPWSVTQDEKGVFTWVSPTGRTHTDTPASNVRFKTSEEADEAASSSSSSSSGSGSSSSSSSSSSNSTGSGTGFGPEFWPPREPPPDAQDNSGTGVLPF